MQGGILVIGSVNADVIIELKRLPMLGETMSASDNSGYVLPGGKGANQAVAASRLSLGVKVSFVCNFGNDGHGQMLRQVMSRENLDISLAQTVDAPSGQAFILLNESGQNSIIIAGGSNVVWPNQLPIALLEAIGQASVVMLQCEVPTHVNTLVAAAAHKMGKKVMLDLGGEDRPLPESIIPHLFMITPNETELARLTKMPTETTAQVVAAARALQARGVASVLCTRGEHGSLYLTDEGEVLLQDVVRVPKVVDTTGAGDTYRAAFAVAYVEGQPLQKCMEFAACAAAKCVEVKGAIPSLPSRAAALSRMAQPFRSPRSKL